MVEGNGISNVKLLDTGSGVVTETQAQPKKLQPWLGSGGTLIQMSDGICSVRFEFDFNIKCAAHARSRVSLPMCALNSIGKLPDKAYCVVPGPFHI